MTGLQQKFIPLPTDEEQELLNRYLDLIRNLPYGDYFLGLMHKHQIQPRVTKEIYDKHGLNPYGYTGGSYDRYTGECLVLHEDERTYLDEVWVLGVLKFAHELEHGRQNAEMSNSIFWPQEYMHGFIRDVLMEASAHAMEGMIALQDGFYNHRENYDFTHAAIAHQIDEDWFHTSWANEIWVRFSKNLDATSFTDQEKQSDLFFSMFKLFIEDRLFKTSYPTSGLGKCNSHYYGPSNTDDALLINFDRARNNILGPLLHGTIDFKFDKTPYPISQETTDYINTLLDKFCTLPDGTTNYMDGKREEALQLISERVLSPVRDVFPAVKRMINAKAASHSALISARSFVTTYGPQLVAF